MSLLTICSIVQELNAQALDSDAFITTWDLGYYPGDHVLTINVREDDFDFNYNIAWELIGDPTESGSMTGLTGDATISVQIAGRYKVSITGLFPHTEMLLWSRVGHRLDRLRSLEQWGTQAWKSMEMMFSGAIDMEYNATDTPILRDVESVKGLFTNVYMEGYDLSEWDVSHIEDFSGMFSNARNVTTSTGNWDVSNATRMDSMFYGARGANYHSASGLDGSIVLSNWDVSKVTSFHGMFADYDGTITDLSGWDVSSVKSMAYMFDLLSHTDFQMDLDLSKWDISQVTDMTEMLSNRVMSAENYSKVLEAWALQDVQPGVNLRAGGLSYSCMASNSRRILINKGWVISGDREPDCVFVYVNNYTTVQVDEQGQFNITPEMVDNGSIDLRGLDLSLSLDRATIDCEDIGTPVMATEPVYYRIRDRRRDDLVGIDPKTGFDWAYNYVNNSVDVLDGERLVKSFDIENDDFRNIWIEQQSDDFYYTSDDYKVKKRNFDNVIWEFDYTQIAIDNGYRRFGGVTTDENYVYAIIPNEKIIVLDIQTGNYVKDFEFAENFSPAEINPVYAKDILYVIGITDTDEDYHLYGFDILTGEIIYRSQEDFSRPREAMVFDGEKLDLYRFGFKIFDGDIYHGRATQVELTATDVFGESTSTIAFITVEDKIAPTAKAQNIEIFLDATGNASISLDQINNGSEDNCGIASVSVDKTAFDCTSVGDTEVVLTVTDKSGNTSTATAIVTVVDDLAPVIQAHNHAVTLAASGTISITPQDVVTSGSDNCGTITYTVSRDSFDTQDVLNSPVTIQLIGTDESGNSTTVPVEVTVIKPAPQVKTKDITINLDDNGNAFITPEMADNGSTDPSGGEVSLSLDMTSFNCSNLGANTVELTVTNAEGISATAEATVTVEDNISPTISINSQTEEPLIVDLGAGYNDEGATVSDNCANSSLTIDNGVDTSAPGTYLVTYTASDASGNTATATRTVEVRDISAPEIELQDTVQYTLYNIAFTQATQNQWALFPKLSLDYDDVILSSYDASGHISYQFSQTEFDCEDLGYNTITLTATDEVGNATTEELVVIIVDETAPIAIANGLNSDHVSSFELIGENLFDNQNAFPTDIEIDSKFNQYVSVFGSKNELLIFDSSSELVHRLETNYQATGMAIYNDHLITVTSDKLYHTDSAAIAEGANYTFYEIYNSVNGDNMVSAEFDDQGILYVRTSSKILIFEDWESGQVTSEWSVPDNSGFTGVAIDNENGWLYIAGGSNLINKLDFQGVLLDQWQLDTGGIQSIEVDPNNGNVLVSLTSTNQLAIYDSEGQLLKNLVNEDKEFSTIGAVKWSNDGHFYVLDITGQLIHKAIIGLSVPANTAEGAVVSFDFSYLDNCTATVSTDPPSGSTFAIGTTPVVMTVTDASGNSDTKTFEVSVFDDEPPVAISKDITVSLDENGNAIIEASDVDNGSSDNSGAVTLSLDRTTFSCNDLTQASSVILTVTDANGNFSTSTSTVTVVDNIAPVVVTQNISLVLGETGAIQIIPNLPSGPQDGAPDTGAGDTSGGAVGEGGISDEEEDEGASQAQSTSVPSGGVAGAPPAGGGGRGTPSSRAAGSAAPSSAGSPSPSGQQATSSIPAVYVDLLTSATIDNCGIESITLSQDTFDWSNIGNNTVSITVTDASGNSTTETVIITIIDNIAPVVLARDIAVQLDENGQVIITPEMVDNGSSDGSGTITLSLSQTNFDASHIGPNTVTLTGSDASGNTASADAMVTVIDPVPIVVTQDITVSLDANGNVTITPEDIDNGSSSVVGLSGLSLDITDFDCSNVGTPVTVTLTATSTLGSMATETALVTVEDNIAPTVITKNITVALDDNGAYMITPSAVNDGTFDNCSFTLSLDNNSFDCNMLGANTVMLTATDASNNSTSMAATVTVVDNAGPVIKTNPITVELDHDGYASITANQVNGGTTDNCAVSIVTIDITSFTCDNLGDNTVTITATDVNNNVSTAQVNVEVVDLIAPIVSTQDISVDLDANGNAVISPEDVLILSASDVETGEDCTVSAAESHAVWLSNYIQSTEAGSHRSGSKSKGKKDKERDSDDDDDHGKGKKKVKGKNTRFVFDTSGGSLHKNEDGTAAVTGTIVSTEDVTDSWIVTLNLAGGYNWSEWSGMGRSYKDEKGFAGDQYLDWTYYEMGEGSNLTGAGRNEGEVVAITHAPTDYRYGFQIGEAANSKNANFGMSGWFFYTNRAGKMVQGDFNLDVTDCSATLPPEDVVITSDNCSIASTSLDVSSFSCGDLGENIVNVTVTDGSGNATTVPVTVTVNDQIGPTAVAQDITVSLGANGIVTVDPQLLDGGSTDNCGIVSWTLDKDTFDCDDIKNHSNGKGRGHYYNKGKGKGHQKDKGHKVTLTVTDAAGHTSSASAYITVVDDVAPVISSEPITLVVYGKKKAYLTKRDVAQAVTDNCAVRYISFARAKYTRNDAGMNTVMVNATDYSDNQTTGAVNVNVVDISSYGKYVTMCYKGKARRVKRNQVQNYLRKGAVLGSCSSSISEVASEGDVITDIEELPNFVPEIRLTNYPNPTSGYTVFTFSSDVDGPARLAIMNTNGVQLATLFNDDLVANEEVEIGYEAGALPSGIYIVRLVTGGTIKNIKLMVKK